MGVYLAYGPYDVKVGLRITKLNKTIYSYDGMLYYLYHRFNEVSEWLMEGQLLSYLDREGLKDLTGNLVKLLETGDLLGLMTHLCSQSPYGRSLDLEPWAKVYTRQDILSPRDQYKRLGDQAYRQENYPDAIRYYRLASSDGWLPSVMNNCAMAYLLLGEYEQGIKLLKLLLDKNRNLEAAMNLLTVYDQLNHHEAMESLLKRVFDMYKDPRVWYYYGRLHVKSGRYEEAIGAFMRAVEETGSQRALEAMVRLQLKLGYQDEASHFANEYGAEETASYLLALCARQIEDDTGYIYYMEQAIRETDLRRYKLAISKYYLKRRQIIKAIEYVGMLHREEQDLEQVILHKALIAREAGNIKEYDEGISSLLKKWKNEVRKMGQTK